jgi:hypothetical protein
MIKTYIKQLSILFILLIVASCEVDQLDANTTTADGGGTLLNYTAYTINSTDPAGTNIYGRIVFWENSLEQTLVQVSVYNTEFQELYPASIIEGAIGTETTTVVELSDVEGFISQYGESTTELDTEDIDADGDTTEALPLVNYIGELGETKFFVITDTTFYDSVLTMDSHLNIYSNDGSGTIVASGDLGINADPVEQN